MPNPQRPHNIIAPELDTHQSGTQWQEKTKSDKRTGMELAATFPNCLGDFKLRHEIE